jgi:hypothetical protein
MQFDTSELDHIEQLHFYEQLKDPSKTWQLEDGAYYKVFYDRMKENFLLVKINVVIHKY